MAADKRRGRPGNENAPPGDGRRGAGETQGTGGEDSSGPKLAADAEPREQGALFKAPPPMHRSLPKPGTLVYVLLHLFLTGESVTQPQWLDRTGSWRLAATVQALKDDHGWSVRSVEIPAPSSRCPHRTIARYSLPQTEIQQGRELLRRGGVTQ